jgi:hypothetical protein
MSEFKQTIEYTFSRVKNGLAELQRWWPVYIKNLGNSAGISVDPILFKSYFGPNDVTVDGEQVDEATTAGIRVEAINDDGTDVSGTEPTIVISGSGGYAPKCRVNHADGTFTEVMLIAPSAEGKLNIATANAATGGHGSTSQAPCKASAHSLRPPGGAMIAETGTVPQTTYTPDNRWNLGDNETGSVSQPGPQDTEGPYPVFMTIQELAEWLDTYRHIGVADDSNKRAWLPHGLIGNSATGITGTSALPAVNADPRLTAGDSAFPTTSPYRATVFMPMLLDNNQMGVVDGSSDQHNSVATFYSGMGDGQSYGGYSGYGITRYNQNPSATDNTLAIKWKTFGKSGDHLLGAHGSFNHAKGYGSGAVWFRCNVNGLDTDKVGSDHVTTNRNDFSAYQANNDISADSSATQGPKYRMKMALAAFLKDGTYSLNNGTIIPYTYDPSRYLGGQTTCTLYATWDGLSGVGSLMDGTALSGHTYQHETSGQIFPMFDFVQGPLAPSAQGQNYHNDVVAGGHISWETFKTLNTLLIPDSNDVLSPGLNMIYAWYGWSVTTQESLLQGLGGIDRTGTKYGDYLRWGRTVVGGYGADVAAYGHQPREFLTRPNPKRAKVLAIEWVARSGITDFSWDTTPGVDAPAGGIGSGGNPGGGFILYVGVQGSSFTSSEGVSTKPQFGPGSAIYLDGLEGILGSNVDDNTLDAHWPGRDKGMTLEKNFDGAMTSVAGNSRDYNGWWIITQVETVAQATGSGTDYTQQVTTADLNTIVSGSTTGTCTWVKYYIGVGPGSNCINWDTVNDRPTAGTGAAGSDLQCYGSFRTAGAPAAYEPGDNCYIRQSRLGGPRTGGADGGRTAKTKWGSMGDGSMVAQHSAGSKGAPGVLFYLIGNALVMPTLSGSVSMPYDARAGTSFQPGLASADSNIPIGANTESTYPGRIAIDDPSLDFSTSNKQIPSEKRFGLVAEDDQTILSAPIVSSKGGGVLRVGAPIGWDLAARYYATPHLNLFGGGYAIADFPDGNDIAIASSNQYGEQDPATYTRDQAHYNGGTFNIMPNEAYDALPYVEQETSLVASNTLFQDVPDRWGHRGLSTPLWSYMEQTTGKHAWDHIKPQINGAFNTVEWSYGRNRPWPAHERMGTRIGYGASLMPDAYNGWDLTQFPATGDFVAAGKETTKIGLSEIGCSPIWLDMEMVAFVPSQQNRLLVIDFDGNEADPVYGRHHMMSSTLNRGCGFGFQPIFNGAGTPTVTSSGLTLDGLNTVYTSGTKVGPIDATVTPPPSQPWKTTGQYFSGSDLYVGTLYGAGQGFVRNRPAIFMGGGTPHWSTYNWENSQIPGYGTGGFGNMGGGTGYGGAFTYTEGTQTIRATFAEKGMTLTLNGGLIGTDSTVSSPIWGFSIKACNIMSFPVRHSGNSLAESRMPAESIVPDSVAPKDSSSRYAYISNPALQVSPVDLQIDALTLRHIPSIAMLPFTVDTTKIQPATDVAKYTSLVVEADNISKTKEMEITATILEPPTLSGTSTIAKEASTVVSGFEDLDLAFAGGVGSIDLSNLPASVVASGFVVRFNFYIPHVGSDLHPINWAKVPVIKSWSVFYDLKPKVELAVVGNTYDGTTASTVGMSTTQSVTSKVGHIVSFRVFGDTLDPDRIISSVKLDFGDGTVTDTINLATPAASTTYDIAHVYTDRPASGYYDVTATVTDDNGNISDTLSPVIRVNLANAEPIPILQTVPSTTRAGTAVVLNGSESYTVDLGSTISNYAFTPGDGSAAVSGSAPTISHTYAAAGEYQASLIVTDSNGTVSGSTTAIIRVLPATLLIPLTLNTKPNSFKRSRSAEFSATPVLDAVYPELNDTGQRSDRFEMTGTFLKATANQDIAFMEELLMSGSLVEFEWEEVNYSGTPTGKTFVGRITSFNYDRTGGEVGQTPWTATLIREAGLN